MLTAGRCPRVCIPVGPDLPGLPHRPPEPGVAHQPEHRTCDRTGLLNDWLSGTPSNC